MKKEQKPIKLITMRELSDMLSVPIDTLRWWRRVGKGPQAFKIEGSVRYDVHDVQRFIEHNREVSSVRAS